MKYFFPNLNVIRLATCIRSYWAVVVAQLVERSLPIPEVRGSNPVIEYLLSTVLKDEKKKRPGMGHFIKK